MIQYLIQGITYIISLIIIDDNGIHIFLAGCGTVVPSKRFGVLHRAAFHTHAVLLWQSVIERAEPGLLHGPEQGLHLCFGRNIILWRKAASVGKIGRAHV